MHALYKGDTADAVPLYQKCSMFGHFRSEALYIIYSSRRSNSKFKIQNSKFNSWRTSPQKNGRNFLEPYPSWFWACCQF